MNQNEPPMEQYDGHSYSEHLRELLRLIDIKSIELTQSYLMGRENRDAHYQLVSLLRQAYFVLSAKIMNNPPLENKFRPWIPVINDPRCLFVPRYENLIWSLQILIRETYERLGITTIE